MNKPMMATLAAVAVCALTVAAAPTFAKPAAAPGQTKPGGAGLKKIADALGLTASQKAQMKPIMQAQRQQVQAIKADTTLTPAAKKAKLQALHQSTASQLKQILTPAQIAKMQALRQQRHLAAGKGKAAKV